MLYVPPSDKCSRLFCEFRSHSLFFFTSDNRIWTNANLKHEKRRVVHKLFTCVCTLLHLFLLSFCFFRRRVIKLMHRSWCPFRKKRTAVRRAKNSSRKFSNAWFIADVFVSPFGFNLFGCYKISFELFPVITADKIVTLFESCIGFMMHILMLACVHFCWIEYWQQKIIQRGLNNAGIEYGKKLHYLIESINRKQTRRRSVGSVLRGPTCCVTAPPQILQSPVDCINFPIRRVSSQYCNTSNV